MFQFVDLWLRLSISISLRLFIIRSSCSRSAICKIRSASPGCICSYRASTSGAGKGPMNKDASDFVTEILWVWLVGLLVGVGLLALGNLLDIIQNFDAGRSQVGLNFLPIRIQIFRICFITVLNEETFPQSSDPGSLMMLLFHKTEYEEAEEQPGNHGLYFVMASHKIWL